MQEKRPNQPHQAQPDLSRFLPELSGLVPNVAPRPLVEGPVLPEPAQPGLFEGSQEDGVARPSTEVPTKRRIRGRDQPSQPHEVTPQTPVAEEEWQEFDTFTKARKQQKQKNQTDQSKKNPIKADKPPVKKDQDFRIGEKAWVEAESYEDNQRKAEEKAWAELGRFTAKKAAIRNMIDQHATPQSDDAEIVVKAKNPTVPQKPGGRHSFTTEDWLERHDVPTGLIKLALAQAKSEGDPGLKRNPQIDPAVHQAISKHFKGGTPNVVQQEEPKDSSDKIPGKKQSRLAESHGAIARVVHRRFGFKMKPWGFEK